MSRGCYQGCLHECACEAQMSAPAPAHCSGSLPHNFFFLFFSFLFFSYSNLAAPLPGKCQHLWTSGITLIDFQLCEGEVRVVRVSSQQEDGDEEKKRGA